MVSTTNGPTISPATVRMRQRLIPLAYRPSPRLAASLRRARRPPFLEIVDQPVRGRIVRRDLTWRVQLRQDRLGELFAELDAPLIEGVDVPDHTLRENLVLVQRDQHAERPRRQLLEHD